VKQLTILEEIIDLARWAPSGDNTQPWRFEILNEQHLRVHGFDTREDCVYDFRGHPSQIALGALLENLSLAAGKFNLEACLSLGSDSHDEHLVFDVLFSTRKSGVLPDYLYEHIRNRTVQRRPYRTTPLADDQKSALSASLGEAHDVLWLEGLSQRLFMAKLNSLAGKLRLSIPEAYAVHRKVVKWKARFSDDRVPDEAIGMDPLSLILMRWIMKSWSRVDFFNTYFGATILPRVELDFLPALACAAHFVILRKTPPDMPIDYVTSGRAIQRLWLTATGLGLQLQPEMSALIFRSYAVYGASLSIKSGANEVALEIANKFDRHLGGKDVANCAIFLGRIGQGASPWARSLRLTTQSLKYKQGSWRDG